MTPKIEESWKAQLEDTFQQPFMKSLKQFLLQEKSRGKTVFPPGKDIFNAFALTPFDQVKVVVLGQDPYHGLGQAHGLSFSVPYGVAIPPSLRNIYKELEKDLGIQQPAHGNLESWAKQGVLMLNSVLTVNQHEAASHQGQGWEQFTDAVISILNQQKQRLVFMLWGSYAHKKGAVIDSVRHLVLRSTHPSPLSAHRGFLGCRHFSQANQYLSQQGMAPIDWQLPQ